MTPSFTSAAMERIWRVAMSARNAETEDVKILLGAIFNAVSPTLSTQRDENFFAYSPYTPDRVLSFLALTELGIRASYLDIWQWEQTPLLEKVARSWADFITKPPDRPMYGLVRSLVARFDTRKADRPARDNTGFNAFESYLHLTRTVNRDESVMDAAHYLQHSWRPASDSAFLMSPRNFADAFAERRIGEVATSEVAGMIRLLTAVEWLLEISRRVEEREELRNGMLVHAWWSNAVSLLVARLDEWATSMSECAQPRDRDGEQNWTTLRREFLALAMLQSRLGLDITKTRDPHQAYTTVPLSKWEQTEDLGHVDTRVDELVAAGRDERARRVLCAALDELSTRAREGDEQDRLAALEDLVTYAQKLAELGDLQSASAFVAPFTDYLVAQVGSTNNPAAQALRLVAHTRRSTQVYIVEDAHQMAVEPTPSAGVDIPEMRYPSLPEDAY